ncbi:MAG: flagellar assembly protein FliX [Acidibrevibacterium sp.]|uniref:flagellar assembly protein FliX n=1 Tax=Acidibrevibacterium sp. TaxID=2606776 RepID=UPI003CFE8031
MIGIIGPFGPGGVRETAPRKASSKLRFAVSSDAAAETAAPAASAAIGGLEAILLLQEAGDEGVADQKARRHGRDLLEELAALQRALLAPAGESGGEKTVVLARLAALAEMNPGEARDPALRAAVAAVVLRARVELARHARSARVLPDRDRRAP